MEDKIKQIKQQVIKGEMTTDIALWQVLDLFAVINSALHKHYGYIIEERFSFLKDGEKTMTRWVLQFNKHFYKTQESAECALEDFKKLYPTVEYRIVPLGHCL